MAQGSVAIAGFQAEGDAAKVTRGVPTVGRIANGALVEREIEFALKALKMLRLALRNPDFTTAKRIAAAINEFMGADAAEPTNPATVGVQVPPNFRGNMVQLLTEVEQLRVEPDQTAKVVIDEQSGIIVMGKDVRVSNVAVAQGNLTVTITETPQVRQPAPLTTARPWWCRAPASRSTPATATSSRWSRGRDAARTRRRAQRARHRPARPDLHPAGHQGRRRACRPKSR